MMYEYEQTWKPNQSNQLSLQTITNHMTIHYWRQ